MWPDKLLFIHSRAKKVKYKKRLLIKKVFHIAGPLWKKKKKKTHVTCYKNKKNKN